MCEYCWLGNELSQQVRITGKLTGILSALQAYSMSYEYHMGQFMFICRFIASVIQPESRRITVAEQG
jgi:hypothetical protein